jgi:hypothetical protein
LAGGNFVDAEFSIFGIGVDRKHVLKWLFPKKATLHALQKVYLYSENALEPSAARLGSSLCPEKTGPPAAVARTLEN